MAAENLGPLSKEEIMAACKTPDPSTEEFIFQLSSITPTNASNNAMSRILMN